ncbi:hypothetical protein N0V84_004029 [Fusarium piperis]|uniref:LysM domain-containing protein n=1 Tax=Fusarium piperis TaxID=1435070 RepID=A0A9W8WGC2_9HYPO|nr:hypothetical protein N0V84_004029 [Fusarium piperis]
MSRFSRYDTDEERLPEGMERVGYDADEQVYTFRDADGTYWESAPGNEYGRLTKVGESRIPEDHEPFIVSEQNKRLSWRNEMRPFLNFMVLIGLCLFGMFWFFHRSGGTPTEEPMPLPNCQHTTTPYWIKSGDTCWDIANSHGISVDDLLKENAEISCDTLKPKQRICLPNKDTKLAENTKDKETKEETKDETKEKEANEA